MACITTSELATLVGFSGNDAELVIFIDTAEQVLTSAKFVACNSYSAATLAMMKKWLSAHFYSVANPQIKREEADDIEDEFSIPTPGKGFDSTHYGRQVLMLDSQGCLARVANSGLGRLGTGYWMGLTV